MVRQGAARQSQHGLALGMGGRLAARDIGKRGRTRCLGLGFRHGLRNAGGLIGWLLPARPWWPGRAARSRRWRLRHSDCRIEPLGERLVFQAARSRSMVSMSARSLNAAGSVARRWASFGLAWMVSSTDTSACTCCSRREFRLLRCGPAGFYLLAQALGQVDQVVHPARNVGRFLAQLLEQLLVDDLGQIGRLRGLALLAAA